MNKNTENIRGQLNYESILYARDRFRKSGTKSGGDFNLYDTPGQKYFKILFYFINGDADGNISKADSSGLLAPTWELEQQDRLYNYNSAWAYLKINGEEERADQLKHFVHLLSNINSESPWYFKELSGLDGALERKFDKEFKIEEERQKISIKCETDAYDDRIGTLLDLYRSVVWSNAFKRYVLPANLRKFDMGIYIMETPSVPMHHFKKDEYASVDESSSSYKTSYKYIEFHNCEFEYNNNKSAYGTLNNADGTPMDYTIEISFDECYERRFNEFELQNIGDMIGWDYNIDSIYDPDKYSDNKEITDSFSDYYSKDFLSNIKAEGIEFVKGKAKGLVNHIYLGNIFGFSLDHAMDFAGKLAQGQLIRSGKEVVNKINAVNNKRKPKHIHNLGNMYKSKTIKNNI